ncbi:MAG: caspase family protein [Pirellulales bacterium]
MTYQCWGRRLLSGLMVLSLAGFATAQERATPRAAFVEEVQNTNQAFLVRVSVDHEDCVYREGDTLTATVRSSASGYLYLFYRTESGKVSCLFPNKYQEDNRIQANTNTVVPPTEGATFRIRIAAPFGKEVLKAVVTKERLKVDDDKLRKDASTPIDFATVKDAVVEAVGTAPAKWAEHSVTLTTIPKDGTPVAPGPRRIGLFIGLAKYQASAIRPLPACRPDAEMMLDTMKKHGSLDEAYILFDEEATLKNIVDLIRTKLVANSKPGDTVFIYWSGHGGRCADDNGDEADGLDEFLVTYDTQTDSVETLRKTSLLDDNFGRIIQHLDGRKVVLLLDTCHSGGQATNEKGLVGLDGVKSLGNVDMLDGELQHTKDIGQKETALLVSSRASQISFVRKEGDLSVMTKFLVQVISDASGPVTLPQAAAQLKQLVPEYVGQRFPGATQTPELIDNTSPPLFLRK